MTQPYQNLQDPDQQLRPERVLRDDTNWGAGKIALFQYVAAAIFLFLLAGFWDLQVRQAEYWEDRAKQNRIKSNNIPAPRGKILDREGRLIVDNHSTFSLYLDRTAVKEEHLKPIAEGVGLDFEDLLSRIRRDKGLKYKRLLIKQSLSPSDLQFAWSHSDPKTFPELDIELVQPRLYPAAGFMAHMIGYVGEVSEQELNADMAKYETGDIVGKAGLEKQYNDWLQGTDGRQTVVVDVKGGIKEPLDRQDPVAGKNLELTIDLDLQAVAELALEGRRGAVVAIDPRNGEVLALASRPTFDLEKFMGRISRQDWQAINGDVDRPLFFRAIQSAMAPGSTFKPFVALAALESGKVDDATRVTCNGGISYYGRYFKCNVRTGHGVVDLRRAISQSCNVFFHVIGDSVGIEGIHKYASFAGFGRKTGIDLPSESTGIMPDPTWKIRTKREGWFGGDTVNVAIGQGYVSVTPLQLASAAGGLAVGGRWFQPHLNKALTGKVPPREMPLDMKNVERIVNGLYSVINVDGTAPQGRIPGVAVAGKTGTAQTVGNDALKANAALKDRYRDNAWFFGFAPKDNPEIIVAALIESGDHGYAAAPIARDVIKAYVDKRERRRQVAQMRAGVPTMLQANLLPRTAARPTPGGDR